MPNDSMLSANTQDYIKVIYKLQEQGNATTNDIAKVLNVSSASVTNMCKKLAEMRLAEYESYRGVRLTPAGMKVALEIIRHHRLLELYLTEALGYSWDKVHDEAERLEHHISEEFEDKVDALLGSPQYDPHGDPIPARDGSLPFLHRTPLYGSAPGVDLIIRRVSSESPEFLRYVERLGLMPGTLIRIVEQQPFDGPITLQCGATTCSIGAETAHNIFVELTA
jgi:DtxR family transcriptional regulator, Mn-dependent transcriptional regulator